MIGSFVFEYFTNLFFCFVLFKGTSASPTTPQFTPESSPSYYQNTGYQGQVFFSRNFTPATSRSTQNSPRHSFRASKRIRRSSTQSYEESDADDEMEIEHTFDTLNRQEKIQDFLGRVPQPRKRKTPDQPQKHNPKVNIFNMYSTPRIEREKKNLVWTLLFAKQTTTHTKKIS